MTDLLLALVLAVGYQRHFAAADSDARVTVLAEHWRQDERVETHSAVEDSYCRGFLADVVVRKMVGNADPVDQMTHDSDVMPDWKA
jgi:hypothetical protein